MDFRLTEERGLVSGRIVDQDWLPVEGMYVLCTYRPDESHLPEVGRGVYTQRDYVQSAHSDHEGQFALGGLPGGRFSVLIGPEDYRPVGKGRRGMRIPIRTVEVRQLERVNLGRIDVWTSRPFRLTGRIDLTGEWAERDSASDELTLLALLQVGERRTRVQEEPVRLRAVPAGLEFDWACENPEGGSCWNSGAPKDSSSKSGSGRPRTSEPGETALSEVSSPVPARGRPAIGP